MSMSRSLQALCGALALAALAVISVEAQEKASPAAAADQEKTSERTAAALPKPLEGTGELTPASPVADSGKAENVGVKSNFGLGRAATKDEIAAIDIDIMPDGHGLPAGRGSYAEGKTIYNERCVACHGENLEGVKQTGGPALIGGRGTLATGKPVKTVESYLAQTSTLYDYIHRAMPLDAPGSLKPDEVYALSAYILGRGGIVDDKAVMDAKSLPRVRMPNADGFIPDPRPAGM